MLHYRSVLQLLQADTSLSFSMTVKTGRYFTIVQYDSYDGQMLHYRSVLQLLQADTSLSFSKTVMTDRYFTIVQ